VTDRLLTAPQVSEILALPVDHVYRLVREGRLPHLKFGRTIRFRAASVEDWLREQERGNGRR
jgi:excisionase family DNA binding protein